MTAMRLARTLSHAGRQLCSTQGAVRLSVPVRLLSTSKDSQNQQLQSQLQDQRAQLLMEDAVAQAAETQPNGGLPPPTGHDTKQSSSTERKRKIVVFGGNGFVGQHVCQEALKLGCEVVSVNRSGAPKAGSWVVDCKWVRGNIFNPHEWQHELEDAGGAVSCVGGFGNDDKMEQICGDANVSAVDATAEAGVPHFVFISAAGAGQGPGSYPVLKGYWRGKQKAEEAVLSRFPDGGVILRCSAIYGTRAVGPVKLPLWAAMKPAEQLLKLPPFSGLRRMGPLEAVFTPPVDVRRVGRVAVAAALGEVPAGVLSVDEINEIAERTRPEQPRS